MDSGEVVVSSIRAGMKREFAMMMKAQSEIGGLPAGGRRMTRSQSTAGSSKGNVQSADKVSSKVKGSESKKTKKDEGEKLGVEKRDATEAVSNVGGDLGGLEGDLVVVERREAQKVGAERPVGETTDLRMKMSKKVELNRIPTKLKDLLETGLLEGLHVRYVHGSKGRKRPEFELPGVIQGAGILCSCDECKERKIVTPNQFEMHAGSGNKRPPEYIFLDNGKSLRDVLNACKANLSESLESVILNAIGRSNYTTAFCINCKELIPEASAGRSMLLCDSCVRPKESDASDAQISDTSRRFPLAGPSAPASSSHPPVVSESAQISSDSQPQEKRRGKLTRKDLRMHKSVLAEDVLPEGTALSYVMHGEKKLEGYKKDGGIFCTCCREVVSPSQFEAHAGFASRRKPYMSIYTSNGVSLHQLSLELSKSRKSSTEEHDDLCSICEDGGDLLCCENCPRGFHTECVGLSVLPQGIWYCKYCQNMFEKEKFAVPDANAIAAGRVPGIDPLEAITQRCIRVVGTSEPEIGGCAICRGHDFCKSGFTARTIILCDQCEKEYHVGCLKEQNIDDLKDRFDPIADASTGRLDLIPHMVYGRHFKDQDFCGMYCAVLMVNSVVVSAGIFRIFGEEVAELPLVATRSECQGKGYFQSLFYCIEGLLASLNVKDLILPAADEAESLWKNRFGFEKLGQEQVGQCLSSTLCAFYGEFTAAISV
ncbi:UNVERIFIED_CONTAM: Increased DNA methylation 1 [Sesamum indicum]